MGEKENNNSQNESLVTRWLRNAVLSATMADQPAMMTASGWRQNEKGDYVQDQQNDPHVKQLRDNLATEGAGVMLGEFGLPALYGLYNLGIRGLGKAGSNYARAKLISREMKDIKAPKSQQLQPIVINYKPDSKAQGITFNYTNFQDFKDVEALKAFANKYSYKLPKGIERYTGDMLDKEFKRILTQHNTFGRGVTANNIEEAEKFLTTAHSGSAGAMDGMPKGKTGIYTMNGLSPYGDYQGVLQRQLDFSGPRSSWIDKNDIPYLSKEDAGKAIDLVQAKYT